MIGFVDLDLKSHICAFAWLAGHATLAIELPETVVHPVKSVLAWQRLGRDSSAIISDRND